MLHHTEQPETEFWALYVETHQMADKFSFFVLLFKNCSPVIKNLFYIYFKRTEAGAFSAQCTTEDALIQDVGRRKLSC